MSERHRPENFETTVNRWYIDTRPYVPQPHNPKSLHALPLLSTLHDADQQAITRFIRPADRFMSLASALLKYTFIHRRAKIPWKEVQISRTPAPHRRPYWEPPEDWSTVDIYDPIDDADRALCQIRGLEYNVSHQAGLVTILGCSTPTPQLPSSIIPNPGPVSPTFLDSLEQIDLNSHPTTTAFEGRDIIRLGVDIACTNEDKRTPKDLNTQAKFDEWIEIFAEMFSDRERRHMRQHPIHVPVKEREEGDWSDSNSSSAASSPTETSSVRENNAKIINMKLRRFYAYWGLKEAYIKMVGEGLLASWLRELEFLDVHAPPPPPPDKKQVDARPSVVTTQRPRNSSVTHAIIEAQGMPLPASADINAHRTSAATVPSLPPLDTNPAPPPASHHRRTSSLTPTADMYAQRPRNMSMTSNTLSPLTAHNHSHSHRRAPSHEYLSPFPDSPSTPSLLDAPRSALAQRQEPQHPEPTETAKWTPPEQAERGMNTLFKGKRVEDVEIELVAYDSDFLIATAMRGVKEREVLGEVGTKGEGSGWWLRLDFEEDIRPCAEGWCSCLNKDALF